MPSGELLLLSLNLKVVSINNIAGEVMLFYSLDNGDCEELVVNPLIEVENQVNKFLSFLESRMSSMPFLPEELPGPDEGCGLLELPADNVSPLVQEQGEITMGFDPLGIRGVHDRF